jgi:hypothetical protein
MEFQSDGNGNIRFNGLAVFSTHSTGAYCGNLLGSQSDLEKHLTAFIPAAHLRAVQETVASILAEEFGSVYRGYLGVDMLVYRKDNIFAIHPFIEINLRNTMGLVALQLSSRLIAACSRGQIMIAFNKEKGKTCTNHLQMQESHPLHISASKIRSGYLPLCPVTPSTQYHAYIMVESADII